ncbi:MAG: D-glucosaminate-6-phosphate ammonia-lyase [Thermomicrobiales bacterium]|jgi:L-seryl-tRNA(Ser) seleniumtransferase|nr:D-glucosaminate-6-phosphate ammonia-lyase [Thermomicrobiales bacterium]
MSIYQSLGVRRVINVDARLTRLGGSLMPQPVIDAMAEAAGSYVDMFELQRAVGRRLAELTNNEAAHVATGAAAGLVLATLACTTGGDLAAIAHRLEGQPAPRNEVIMHRAHRIPYDPAVLVAGGKIVEVGNVSQTFPWEFEAAFTERTGMVLFIAGEHLRNGALSLEETIRISHEHGVPVVVDAAAQLPPVENLWRYTRDLGADLAVFSGGKELRGPQASGLIVGRADLIEAIRAHGAPNQRLGRPMKVGKEEMIGLLAAVELYLNQDHAARIAGYEATVRRWIARFDGRPGITARRGFPNEAGQPTPRALIEIDPEIVRLTGAEVKQRLWEGDPAISFPLAGPNILSLTPDCLDGDDEQIVLDRLDEVLIGAPVPA